MVTTGCIAGRWALNRPARTRIFTSRCRSRSSSSREPSGSTTAKWIDANPGDFLYVPEGGVHGFRNESGDWASMLILFAPGAPREKYFEGLAEMGRSKERPSEQEWAEFMQAHDTYWV